ncbi:MAG: amino acid racemase [Rhodothermales bacterium]|nr:amino acid racemase [Rhodothermales bacterium]
MDERSAIGVVGGLGPYAGLDLVKKVFDHTVASTDQDHLPVVLINFPGHIPDRSTYIADQAKPNPVPPLLEVLRRLEAAGCAVAGMPCNTAHAPVIFDALVDGLAREGRSISLLNMIDASAEATERRAPGARRVGVLGTNATVQQGLYDRALAERGLECVTPEWDFQDHVVNPVIFDTTWGLKAQSDPPTERARAQLLEGVRHLEARGAEVVILGCTELPLAVPEAEFEGVPLVDSTRSLARALIRETHPHALRPLADALGLAEAGDGVAVDGPVDGPVGGAVADPERPRH